MNKLFVFLLMVILVVGFVATAQADSKVIYQEKPRVDRSGRGAPTPVPEPVTLALLGGGLVGLYGLKKKFGKD